MSDLIKREDAIKAFTFNSKGERIPFVDCDNFPVEFPLRYIVDTLVALLPADRPQGEWIDKGWKGDWQFETDGRGHCWKVFECSVCNGWDTRKTRFCPNCGAKMDGERKESE